MKAISVFAGIGGFELGLAQAGIATVAQIEVNPRCQELLRRRFNLPLWGDVREVNARDLPEAEIYVGGFPCQGLSVAGRRRGFADPRTQLFWEFLRLAEANRPRWLIIENVPGLLSSSGGRDMGTVLGALADRGYGWAYRVLDAAGFGVPQRRRRVFIVAHLGGSPEGPVQVLDLAEGSSRDPAPRRRPETIVGALTTRGLGAGGAEDNVAQAGHLIPVLVRMREGKPGGGKGPLLSKDVSLTLATGNDQVLFQPLGFVNQAGWVVRKLTPVECERLQGFPDGWTEGFSDTVRYRMLGNAVCVPVIAWIAKRLVARRGDASSDAER